MKMRRLLPLAIAMLSLSIPHPSDARGGAMAGHGGAFVGRGGAFVGHGGVIIGPGGGTVVGRGGVFSGPGTVIIPARPFFNGGVAQGRRPFDGTFGSPFPFVPAVPLDDAPTVEINVPPAVVVAPDEVQPVPVPPSPRVVSGSVRRDPAPVGPKMIVPPPPVPDAPPCVHTVTVYRGAAMEVQSFPIPDCTATTSAKKPAPRG